jgi:hypothetical protein
MSDGYLAQWRDWDVPVMRENFVDIMCTLTAGFQYSEAWGLGDSNLGTMPLRKAFETIHGSTMTVKHTQLTGQFDSSQP